MDVSSANYVDSRRINNAVHRNQRHGEEELERQKQVRLQEKRAEIEAEKEKEAEEVRYLLLRLTPNTKQKRRLSTQFVIDPCFGL